MILKNYKTGIGFLLSLVVATTSCNKVLDKSNLNSYSDQQIFGNIDLATAYIDRIYDDNSPGWPSRWMNVSDETGGSSVYFDGTVDLTDVQTDFGTGVNSGNFWGKMRAINQAILSLKSSTLSPDDRNHLIGQAYFFRAYNYFELVKLYGGVPLVLTPQNAIGDQQKQEAALPRNKTSECFAQMVKDLDSSIANLPPSWSNDQWGRLTRGAAAALKGRILLYWASPLFNPDDLAPRWQNAFDANAEALSILNEDGKTLNGSFENLWFQEVGNPEVVWSVGFNTSKADQLARNASWGARPRYWGGNGSNQPAKGLVDAFPMKDGKDITDLNGKYYYSDQLFYKNRDPRFAATIAYNGQVWKLDGNNNPGGVLWAYTANGTSVEPNATGTGFYCRKGVDPAIKQSDVPYSGTDWIEIRYAEVLLNYAEAAVGVNQPEEAIAQLVKLRRRAGIEPGDDEKFGLKSNLSRADMFTQVLHERQIELALEGKRFWDLKRWKLFEPNLNGTRRMGIQISLRTDVISVADFNAIRDGISIDEAYEKYFSIAPKVLDSNSPINWQPNYYFFGIPTQAIQSDPLLKQTKGWEGGTFDPLL